MRNSWGEQQRAVKTQALVPQVRQVLTNTICTPTKNFPNVSTPQNSKIHRQYLYILNILINKNREGPFRPAPPKLLKNLYRTLHPKSEIFWISSHMSFMLYLTKATEITKKWWLFPQLLRFHMEMSHNRITGQLFRSFLAQALRIPLYLLSSLSELIKLCSRNCSTSLQQPPLRTGTPNQQNPPPHTH